MVAKTHPNLPVYEKEIRYAFRGTVYVFLLGGVRIFIIAQKKGFASAVTPPTVENITQNNQVRFSCSGELFFYRPVIGR